MTTHQSKLEKLFLHAARMLNSTLEYEELMRQVLELTVEATGSEAALAYRLDKNLDIMKVRFFDGRDYSVKTLSLPRGQGIIGWVAEHQEPIIANDVTSDPRYHQQAEIFGDLSLRSVLAIPLIGRGQMIGVIEAINKIDGVYTDEDLDILVGLANQMAVAIDNARLYREAKQEAMERQLLYDVGKKLSSTLNIDEVLQLILDSLQKVVGFDAGGVFLINDEKGEVATVFAVGYDPLRQEYIQLKIGQGLVGWVAKNGEAVIVPDVTKDTRYISARQQTKSEIVTPIRIDGRIIGVLNLESDHASFYNRKSLELITAFASHAAISIERAMLHKKMLENRRLEEQLSIAREIQLTFLPKHDPQISGYDISGVNIPSGEVGGDYFDFIKIIEHQTGIAIADVAGKGIPASLIMAAFRASLIAEIRNNYAIRMICRKVNSLIYESVERENYVTAVYGVLDSKNDIFTFSNCGHNHPILLRRGGRVEYLKEGGLALGVIPDTDYEERPIFIQSGDTIMFYTDGVSEAKNGRGEDFGVERLVAVLKRHKDLKASDLLKKIYEAVKEYASETHVFDDLTMLIIKKI
ncbi:Serine phosphatase RsbU [Candidatus Zixiibacteriota bacterium]|nr:Serine phosphatase RsbU [candidate division Zixibacteria bacterium]